MTVYSLHFVVSCILPYYCFCFLLVSDSMLLTLHDITQNWASNVCKVRLRLCPKHRIGAWQLSVSCVWERCFKLTVSSSFFLVYFDLVLLLFLMEGSLMESIFMNAVHTGGCEKEEK